MAEQSGLDLRALAGRGSGPGGRIVRRDVEEAAQRGPAREAAPAAPAAAPAPPAAPVVEQSHEDRELTRLRQLIARNLAASKPGAPHIYLTVEVEMDAALALRRQLNDLVQDERERISVNDLANKAVALALRKFPDLNTWYVDEKPPKIRAFRRIDLGMGIQAEDGLLVGVIRAADTKSLTQIARESKDLYEKIRAGKRAPEDLSGATFTTSNLGQWGIDEFQAVINPPQAGILAIGAAAPKAVVRDGQVAVRTTMRATISADHRVVDGVYAARFLQELKRLLENPLSLVL
jgi:pyruvate dehydrogenase E2 component (dihydrolipoamide acetyltransferase)